MSVVRRAWGGTMRSDISSPSSPKSFREISVRLARPCPSSPPVYDEGNGFSVRVSGKDTYLEITRTLYIVHSIHRHPLDVQPSRRATLSVFHLSVASSPPFPPHFLPLGYRCDMTRFPPAGGGSRASNSAGLPSSTSRFAPPDTTKIPGIIMLADGGKGKGKGNGGGGGLLKHT
ncbi:uncharacterized protein LY79DRAFT_270638 [Colletotrichum navitas]|uniref:Uncharacterized protein n=1 Tax=Colletotrichum navitas TaxID=681940 RepID=A0AAD8V437_9PEZI|nr:uncharacterized protein LY79DRAFT_270638 [Colletotrichum navitas]KAK1585324.1 hypothetical protein LY79DRAFT_270638 [Colletotrichum navitas]